MIKLLFLGVWFCRNWFFLLYDS